MVQNMLVQEPIQAAIWHCLNSYAYVDATFLAERLLAEVDTEEALYLLATVYYRSGKPGRAYTVLQTHGYNTPQLKYLMAKCCYDLGKLDEAEVVLTGGSVLKAKQTDEIVSEYGTIACFALQLLGLICAKTERMNRASEVLRKSLKLNPFMWQSFAVLCDQGDKVDPSKIFKLDTVENFSNIHGNTVCSVINNTDLIAPNNPDVIVTNNTLSNVSLNTPVNETGHPIHSLIHTQSQPHLNPPHISTPNNLSPLPCITTGCVQQNSVMSTPIQPSITGLNTPVAVNLSLADTVDSSDVNKMKKFVRFKRISPIMPSFGVLPVNLSGVLPLNLSQSGESDLSSVTTSLAFFTPSPNPYSTLESQPNNKLQMNLGKRILCRNSAKDSPLVMNKPAVFAPTGNNSNFQSPPSGQQAYVRRSSRLFGNSSSVKENNKNRFVAPKSPARKTKTRSSKTQSSLSELNEKNKSENHDIISTEKPLQEKVVTPQNLAQQAFHIQKHSAEGLMSLFRDIGAAYFQLSQYNCKKTIELFSALPSHHYNTGWVLAHIAKAYFEMNDYNQAVRFFSEVREKEPHSLHLMEYYSTSLWHLQKEVQLSALAQDLVEVDRDAPEAWCATGNCFSLQKEHDAAIKFFSRAIQVNPNFAYAYTFLGHEHLATEELDRALSCFRSAVRIDPRHYNAWYGIGLVLSKQERFSQAEWYFKKAVSIHPQCSILLCHVAVVEHTLQKSNAALITLKRALTIEPSNPLCKYNKALILHALDRHLEALDELLQLKEIVPKESNVYFLLGKVYKRLGDTHLALMNFSWAMDLDPKGGNNQLKEAIDPAINCFSVDDDENANSNPQDKGPSDSSCSLAAAESSQESLILEQSSDMGQLSGLEDPPTTTHNISISVSRAPPCTTYSPASPDMSPTSDVLISTAPSKISYTTSSMTCLASTSSGMLDSGSHILSAPGASSLTTPSSSNNVLNMYSTPTSSILNSSLASNTTQPLAVPPPPIRGVTRYSIPSHVPVFNMNDTNSPQLGAGNSDSQTNVEASSEEIL